MVVEVTATTRSVYQEFNTPVAITKNFQVTFNNPCIDTEFVNIVAQPLDRLSYVLDSGMRTYDPHAEFLVETEPIDHSYCGILLYEAVIGGSDEAQAAVSYNDSSREVTVSSTN